MLLLRIMLAEPHQDLVAILHTNIGNDIYILLGPEQITGKLEAAPDVLCNDILAQYATALDYNISVQTHPVHSDSCRVSKVYCMHQQLASVSVQDHGSDSAESNAAITCLSLPVIQLQIRLPPAFQIEKYLAFLLQPVCTNKLPHSA